MSCIAVNIHEIKQETVKIELVHPVYGKNGKQQMGVFRDASTGKEITSYTLPKPGFYACKTLYVGHDVNGVVFARPNELILLKQNIFLDNATCYYAEYTQFVSAANMQHSLAKWIDLEPTTTIEYFCTCYQFIPE